MSSKMKKRKVKPSAFIALFLLIFLCLVAFGYKTYQDGLKPAEFTEDTIMIEIETGTTLYAALDQLENEGIIRNASFAKIYAKLNKLNDIKAGIYEISSGMDTPQIIEYLQGNNAIIDQVMITIPEGYWAKQIADLLGSQLSVSSEELLTAWNDPEYVRNLIEDYDVLTEEIINDDAKVLLEGYLFPETYSFIKETNVDEVTRRLLNQTEKIYDKYIVDFKKSTYSVHELMTLASILQFESGDIDDMKLIASVFYNRLNSNMMLQSSVTVCYAIYDYSDWKACEYYADVDSPYNTYHHYGLPPSPIMNPGEHAIEAVLHPADSDYYFFIGDVYGNKGTIFAKTYEEHLANIEKYLK